MEANEPKRFLHKYLSNNEMFIRPAWREQFIMDIRAILKNVDGLTIEAMVEVVEEIHLEDGCSLECPMCGKEYDLSYSECICEK